MELLLCTIGFAGKRAEEFFSLLSEANVQSVIDIRQHRDGQLSGFAKHPDLGYFLRKIVGIAYSHEPQLAPAPELLKSYRDSKDWATYETQFLALMQSRRIPESLDTSAWPARAVLLCSEPGPEKCHRRLVADLLADYWRGKGHTVEVRHLIAARSQAAKSSSATGPAKQRNNKSPAAP